MKKNKALLTISIMTLLLASQAWAGDRGRDRHENKYRDHSRVEHHNRDGDRHRSYKKEQRHRFNHKYREYGQHGSRFAPGKHHSGHSRQHYYRYHHKPRYYSGHYYRGRDYGSRHHHRHYSRHHDGHDIYKWLVGGILLNEAIHHSRY